MTKKSTTSAVAAVAALVLVAGSAGAHAATSPAGASIAPGDIVFAATGLNGTGVQPDTTSPNHDQAWFELISASGMDESLDGLTVVGCVGAADDDSLEFGTYSNLDEVSPFIEFRTADAGFSGTADVVWDDPSVKLDSVDFDLRLVDNFGGFPEEVVAHTTNGNPDQDCVDSLPPITP